MQNSPKRKFCSTVPYCQHLVLPLPQPLRVVDVSVCNKSSTKKSTGGETPSSFIGVYTTVHLAAGLTYLCRVWWEQK